MDRAVPIAGFLAQQGWDSAEQTSFDADFSPRRYARLLRDDNRRAILMDADEDQNTHAFVLIDKALRHMGLSAPEIYAADPMNGLVLMEDFGNRNFGRLLDSGEDAKTLYLRAADVLVHLHKNFDKALAQQFDLPAYGGALFSSQVELYIDVYFPYVKEREATIAEAEAFRAAWKTVLKGIETLPQSLLLRDFMPDNLMDLKSREGVESTGLLDFQDAGFGPIAYDLASLCEVVRRDGGDEMLDSVIKHYHAKAQPALTLEQLTSACHLLSAQRHMRILGVLVRIAQKTGQREKLTYIHRVREHLSLMLQDDVLKPVREWLDAQDLA